MFKKLCIWTMATLAAMTAVSCSEEETPEQAAAKGQLTFAISFSKIQPTRAELTVGSSSISTTPVSQTVPETSWSNISYIQIFLYDHQGVVHFSDVIDMDRIASSLAQTGDNTLRYTYRNVPAGTYYLSAVANANSAHQTIRTELNNLTATWTPFNVINRFIYNCRIRPANSQFPDAYLDALEDRNLTRDEHALATPTELFLGRGTIDGTNPSIDIADRKETKAVIDLQREVSMMRLRINLADAADSYNNADRNMVADGKVDFNSSSALMIATVPDCVIPMSEEYRYVTISNGIGDATTSETVKVVGGTSETCSQSSIFVLPALEGNLMFHTSNPTSGYTGDKKIIGIDGDRYNANAWRDIMVLPNDKVRQLSGSNPNNPLLQNRYMIIISALGLPGHKTREGVLTEPKTVYWTGYINEGFHQNQIREVNINFKDGGSQEPPERSDNRGSFIIEVADPADWWTFDKDWVVEL